MQYRERMMMIIWCCLHAVGSDWAGEESLWYILQLGHWYGLPACIIAGLFFSSWFITQHETRSARRASQERTQRRARNAWHTQRTPQQTRSTVNHLSKNNIALISLLAGMMHPTTHWQHPCSHHAATTQPSYFIFHSHKQHSHHSPPNITSLCSSLFLQRSILLWEDDGMSLMHHPLACEDQGSLPRSMNAQPPTRPNVATTPVCFLSPLLLSLLYLLHPKVHVDVFIYYCRQRKSFE